MLDRGAVGFARRAVLGAGLVLLVACETTPPSATFAEITFAHLPPIVLDVAGIEYVEQFVAPLEPPHAEDRFPIAPAVAARRWVQDRLVAGGGAGTARVVLTDASGTREALATQGGVTGFFTDEQAERYGVSIVMRLEIVAEGSRYVEGHVEASARQSTTVAEDATLEERDRALYRLTETVMQGFNKEFETGIRSHLGRFVLQ
ncbi:MAG: hypothetical protein WD673_12485 [Alphaproteobacteria bacterium]